MEGLILVFGELVFAILTPFVVLVVDLVGSVLGLTISFGTGRKTGAVGTGRTARVIALVLLGFATLTLIAIWIVNSFYFENAVRHVFGMAERRSAITTTCESIEGSLFAGRVDLQNCTIRRPSHPASSFDLRVDEVALDLRVTSLLGTASIDVARVVGLHGWIDSDRSTVGQNDGIEQAQKPKRAFVIGDLDVSDVDITLSGTNPDGNRFQLPVEIGQITSQPLRSRLALFDILFRSNSAGSIAGAPFEISSSPIPDGRQTTWRAKQVPVASIGALTGGALSWFTAGTVDVHVDDRWQRADSLSVDMDWKLQFEDVEVNAPTGAGAMTRLASGPLTRYVNGLDGHFPLEFQVVVNESQFEFKSSLAAAGLWSAVGESVNKVLGTLGIDLENASETGNAIKEGAKSVLDRLRKPKSDEPD